MGFLSLLAVAWMPVLQFLLIGLLGAFLASGYSNVLSASARRDINKVSYVVFAPTIVFASLAKSVTLHDLISWWYMPVNIGMTFLIGGVLGWVAVKILRPERHLQGLIIGSCSAANLGNLPLILVPALCNEIGNPFGDGKICRSRGLSYVSLSMSLGAVFIWTHTYSLMKKSAALYNKAHDHEPAPFIQDLDAMKIEVEDSSTDQGLDVPLLSTGKHSGKKVKYCWDRLKGILHQLTEELSTPPTIATIVGLIVGVIPWLKSLIIGPNAPLRVIQDSITTLGGGLIPSIVLILGGNLTQGLSKQALKPLVIVMVLVVRYVMLPISGIGVVKIADGLGFLPPDPLFHYVLMLQFALPPALSIGTMAQLFDVATEECSLILLWTYLVAAIALTAWSTVFMWLLS